MNMNAFRDALVAAADTGDRKKIAGAVLAGDNRTPLTSVVWTDVILPVLQQDAGRSKLDQIPAAKHSQVVDAFTDWVAAVSKKGPSGPLSSDQTAIDKAKKKLESLDKLVGSAKKPAAKKPAAKPAAKKPAAKKPAAKKPAAKKPAAATSSPRRKGTYRVRLDLTFEEI